LIRINHEFDSNKINENDLQPQKHADPIISRVCGISIDPIDEPRNTAEQI
jgi:hypothetical protein